MEGRRAALVVVAVAVLIAVIVAIALFWPTARENALHANDTSPRVSTAGGIVRGVTMMTVNKRSIYGFMGIPYAEPPVGKLRFASPVAKGSWSGILEATRPASACYQFLANGITGQEDCLYLNIYTPQLPDDENRSSLLLLPVMVFIHGGAFSMGNSGSYDPGYLLDKDIVLVLMNYRLGPFGFLSTGDEAAPGNFALKDQLLASQWVRDNVASFGGDPNKMTIAGQSAGAACAHLLTLSRRAIGLFRGLVTMSGVAQSPWSQQPRDAYAKLAYGLGENVGCSNATSTILVECLRKLNESQILTAGLQLYSRNGYSPPVLWSPTVEPDIEDAVLPNTVENLLASGKDADIPWLNSIVKHEGIVATGGFYTNPEYLAKFLDHFDNLLQYMMSWGRYKIDVASMTSAVKAYYFNNDLTTNRSILFWNMTDVASYELWRYPTKLAVERYEADRKSPVYLYSFEYRGTSSFGNRYTGDSATKFGAVHSDDLLYTFFSNWDNIKGLAMEMSTDDLAIKDVLVRIISSFVIDGKPSIDEPSETWEPYSSSKQNYLRIGNGSSVDLAIEHSFVDEQMRFWVDAVSKYSST